MAAGAVIEARTLGGLVLSSDDLEVPAALKWRKNSALLAYLARSERPRSREHLCGLLWPEKPESSARHSLNEALRVLRKTLGDGAIEADARQVALAEGFVVLDVDALNRAVLDEAWADAAAIAGGEFLEGFGLADASGFEDWLASERTRWRERSVQALVGRARQLLAAGDLVGGGDLAHRALLLDPFSDLAAQAAIRALALSGDRGGALAAYEGFAQRLATELGAEPAPETERLSDRVRRERTWRLPAAIARDPVAASRTALLGRARELEALLAGWDRCRLERRATFLLLEGEPGIGKTRLIEEVAGRGRLDGGIVAGIRSVPADRHLAGSGLRGLCNGGLLDAPGVPSTPDPSLAAIAAELPEWADRFPATVEPDPAPLSRAFSDLIVAISDEQPTLLFIDDAEHLDTESREALVFLARNLERRPVAVIVAASGPSGREILDEVRVGVGEDVHLEGLSLQRWEIDACTDLVGSELPGYESDARARLARRILADSAGLPLLAVAIAQAVRDGLALDDAVATEAWPATDRTLDSTMPGQLPETVRSAIRVGFRRLSKPAQMFLSAAAVLDEDRFESAAIGRLTGQSAEECDDAARELEWHRWLNAEPRGYGFVARIVADILAEDMLTPGQRRRYRERATSS